MDAITGFLSSAADAVKKGAQNAAAAVTGESADNAVPATGLSNAATSGDPSALSAGRRRRASRTSRRAGKKTARVSRKGGRKHSKSGKKSRKH